MSKKNKLKAELILEVAQLQERVVELETADTEQKLTLEMFQKSEEKYRALYENSPLSYQSLDEDGCLIDVNPAWLRTLGYERDQVIGKWFGDFLHPDWKPHFEISFSAFKKHGYVHGVQFKMKHQDGHYLDILFEGRISYDPDGKFKQTYCVFEDITERVQVEQKYKDLVEKAGIAVLIDDREGNFVYFNETFMELFGYSEQEIQQKNIRDLVHPEDLDQVLDQHNKRLERHPDQQRYEFRGQRKDGTFIQLEVDAVLLEENNTVIGTRSYLWDITERVQAEEALRESDSRLVESNQLLSGILEHTHMMAVFLDAQFNFIWVNRAYADTCGDEPSFFPGKNHFDLYPHKENQAIFQHVVDTGEPFFVEAKPFEFPDKPERGVTFWDWSLIPVNEDSGRVTGLVFTLADVTDRVRAEEGIRLHAAMLKNVAEGIYLVGWDDLLIKWTNDKFAKMFSYDPDEMIGMQVDMVNAPTERTPNQIRESITDVLKETREWHGEVRNIKRDGTHFWCYANVSLFDHPEYGKVILSVHTDITERKQAEVELRESEEKYQKLFDGLPYGGEVIDTQGYIIDASESNSIVYGYERDELIGKHITEFLAPAAKEIYRELFPKILNGEPGQAEIQMIHKDGSLVNIIRSARPLFNQQGSVVSVLATNTDITERIKVEQEKNLLLGQLQMANERLKTLNRERINLQEEERKRISQELHDELGQALTAITLDLGIIERELDPETDRDIRKRLSETRTIANELDQKIDELAFDLRPSILDDLGLIPTLEWYVDRYSQRTKVEVEIEVIGRKKRLPPEMETALYRITQEALTNVVKHAQAKTVKLRLDQQPKAVKVTIEDDGGGFDLDALQSSLIPPQGLGLIGMRDRISLLGGRLDIHSKPGEGTRIEIEIPL